MDKKVWPYLSKYDEWAVMKKDRRRTRFPHQVVIGVRDAYVPGVGSLAQKWADFCYEQIGDGGCEHWNVRATPSWRWKFTSCHSRTSAHTFIIFAFPTEVELIIFKMGVMHE